jgi:hypothetical protein
LSNIDVRVPTAGHTCGLSRCIAFLIIASAIAISSQAVQPQQMRGREPEGPIIASVVLERLRHFAPAVEPAASCPRENQIAGRYTRETSDLAAMMGGGGFLSGSNLYLLRDGSYFYTEWADISPEAILDKGRWFLHKDVLELKPDGPERKEAYAHEHYYAVFCLRATNHLGLRIIGNRQLAELEADDREGPQGAANQQFRLLLHSCERIEEYSTPESSRSVMEKLRRISWRRPQGASYAPGLPARDPRDQPRQPDCSGHEGPDWLDPAKAVGEADSS